jgi:hypothetical protein
MHARVNVPRFIVYFFEVLFFQRKLSLQFFDAVGRFFAKRNLIFLIVVNDVTATQLPHKVVAH